MAHIRNNLDWAGFLKTSAERMTYCKSEEDMYRQLKKFKEEFNTEYGKLSRAKRRKTGFRDYE